MCEQDGNIIPSAQKVLATAALCVWIANKDFPTCVRIRCEVEECMRWLSNEINNNRNYLNQLYCRMSRRSSSVLTVFISYITFCRVKLFTIYTAAHVLGKIQYNRFLLPFAENVYEFTFSFNQEWSSAKFSRAKLYAYTASKPWQTSSTLRPDLAWHDPYFDYTDISTFWTP